MHSDSASQLPLGIRLNDDATFANFLVSPDNEQLLEILSSFPLPAQLIYLWGAEGNGRSHLLQALCHRYAESGAPTLYLPLLERRDFAPQILEHSRTLSVICFDDIDAVGKDSVWQESIFHSINEAAESNVLFVVSASCAPRDLALSLQDLLSRMQRGLTFQVQTASDDFKKQVLQHRAKMRGMSLSEQVSDYILQRADRSLFDLIAVLERLDAESVQRQRRLTVPFVKDVMDW
ncbi:MAG TPA: DnaA regulatory inactivator Hda [Gammaproteobacteria bacterium]|nr:DnaA regulatory inactivator Hda [Gammaproteobacteria bacterium]|tara:strand:+ start:1516 stop:2217 length:702 start_codon:yes stop_codon:yes gene_type:complete